MDDLILTINAGSSSIKFAVFASNSLSCLYSGEVDKLLERPVFSVQKRADNTRSTLPLAEPGFDKALTQILEWLQASNFLSSLKAIGHRVVHGGRFFQAPALINDRVLAELKSLNPLAPLHQPHELAAIELLQERLPDLPQLACFDTSFHQNQDPLATCFAIPQALTEEGIIRYGFHGLAYEDIASKVREILPGKTHTRVIAAHLGHGASLCAIKNGKSLATSMGFTALDGLMMGTRCGSIDPGVLLYLLQEKGYTADKLNALLYLQSGLLGVSGVSSDMRVLEASKEPAAAKAIDLFCYRVVRETGSLYAALGGCDALVFSGGIGENSALVRSKISSGLGWMGLKLDEAANAQNHTFIQAPASAIPVAVLHADEELVIARHCVVSR